MKPLRLLLVTRRFWPIVGGGERAMAILAGDLAARGHLVTVLTAAWQPHWPSESEYAGARLIRIKQSSIRFWGTWCYMRAVERWIAEHLESIDLACVSMLKHDAYATLRAVRGRFPVVLRAEGAGATGDCRWHAKANFGRRIGRRCRAADAIVAPSPAIQQELCAAGFAADKLEFIPNGAALGAAMTSARRIEARRALATGNPTLALTGQTPLAVYTGRLQEGKGLEFLVDAWPSVLCEQPDARLWLVGEGPQRQALAEQIERLQLTGRVLLAGAFDRIEEVLAAADVFVLASFEEGMSLALLEAMAQGLPIVAADIAGNRNLVTDLQQALLVPPGDAPALAGAVLKLLGDHPLAERLGNAARVRVDRHFSLARMVDLHLSLFNRLIGNH